VALERVARVELELEASLHPHDGHLVRTYRREVKSRRLLRPKQLADASQAYFWTDSWQAAEGEASEDIAKGRVKTSRSVDIFIGDLHKTRDARRPRDATLRKP
jgi:hypothetical protein